MWSHSLCHTTLEDSSVKPTTSDKCFVRHVKLTKSKNSLNKGNTMNMEWWSFIMRRWHYQFYFSIISNAFLYISLNYHRTIRIYDQDYRIGNRESGNSYSIAKLFLLSTFPDICQIIINYGLFYIIFSNWSFVAWLPSCSCTASAPVQSIKVNVYSSSY